MARSDVLCVVAGAGLLAFAVVYALDVSEPMYYPTAGVWAAADAEGLGPGMGWYARSVWGLGAGLGAGALTAGLLGGFRRRGGDEAGAEPGTRLSGRGILLLTVLVLGVLIALMVHIAVEELHGVAQPVLSSPEPPEPDS